MVSHFTCLLFTGYIIYVTKPGSSLFSWHPALMTIAFGLLVPEALLIFSSQSSLLSNSSRSVKLFIHWLACVSAALCAVFGLTAIVVNKERLGKEHGVSWHGYIGAVTFIYICIQLVAGGMLKYHQVSPLGKLVPRLVDAKQMHATSGLLLCAISTVALITGMFSTWFTNEVTGTSWYLCVICPMISLLIAMYQVTEKYLPKTGQQ